MKQRNSLSAAVNIFTSATNDDTFQDSLSVIDMTCTNKAIEQHVIGQIGSNAYLSCDSTSVSLNCEGYLDNTPLDKILRQRFFQTATAHYIIKCQYGFSVSGYFIITQYSVTQNASNKVPKTQITLKSHGQLSYVDA